MNKSIVLHLIFGFCLCVKAVKNNNNNNNNNEFYVAGVVEYGNSEAENVSAERYIANNLHSYLNFIEQAKKKNVDILVFPEATLNYFNSRKKMVENAFELPKIEDKIAPWEYSNLYSDVLRNISKHCKDNQIYVLINLVEKISCGPNKIPCKRNDGYNLYNTNVVFDRQGRIISKYQKYNLFIEPDVDTVSEPQHSTFTTDFNVKFGHFICFDIMFQEPAIELLKKENITNILYPSMWFSDMPFLVSTQIHSSWAYANDVNLISSGASNPSAGSTGSGIFLGKNKIATELVAPQVLHKLLISNVPKDLKKYNAEKEKQQSLIESLPPKYNPIEMQNLRITDVWSEDGIMKWDIMEDEKEQKICAYNDVCCIFQIKLKHHELPPNKIAYKYMLVANYTTRSYGRIRNVGEIYCSVISCTNNNQNSCGRRFKNNDRLFNAAEFEKISITAKIRKSNNPDDLLVMPSTLDTSVSPLNLDMFNFRKINSIERNEKQHQYYRMESKGKLKNILTFGIFGRNFEMDSTIEPKRSRG